MNITQSMQNWSIGKDIRLPKNVAEQAKLSLNEQLEVTIKDNFVLLAPFKKKKKVTLEKLFANVTPEDVGGELTWGSDTGAEVYA